MKPENGAGTMSVEGDDMSAYVDCVRSEAGSERRVALFFAATYALTWALFAPILLSGQPLFTLPLGLNALFFFATVAPSLVACVIATMQGGRRGLVALLRQATLWRFGVRWYATALLLAALLDVIALAVDILAGRGPRSLQLMFQIQLVIPFAALGEEFGWRGYALPRLQKLYRPLPAALILGVVWAFWHLPYFVVAGNYPSPAALYFIPFAIGIVASSVLISWIYNSTGGSLPATILYHAALNIAVAIPQSDGLGGLWVNTSIFALCALIVALSSPVFRRAVSGTCVMRSSESDA